MTLARGQLDPQTIGSSRRTIDRRKLYLHAQGTTSFDTTDVLIRDMSRTGLLIETTGSLSEGETIELELAGNAPIRAIVRWHSGQFFGCQFETPVSDAVVSAALLRAPRDPETPYFVSPSADKELFGAAEDQEATIERFPLGIRMWSIIGAVVIPWTILAAVAFLVLV